MSCTRIRVVERGPMLVDGPVEITMPDGSQVVSDRSVVALCMCKRSKIYPFCDTSHRARRERTPVAKAGRAAEDTVG
ncbi:CDGSH iron-sulfur domain-containing protein [Rhodococcus sp. H29-C3]|uniref:CDGSH iron-sulfur domain-containing protein n=1 Tax=Rhodococcus sp. H29-C3 TaxID=3046307 RepID=UPI0024B98DE8|nr:CDGSH iron-sulfur domain-containing protein [Rhodococcus sp. H29-C3]MDJ0361978.1 CDGSH iron-sulfur domain-containing protein [Rhodococcus sp. H29-C3]